MKVASYIVIVFLCTTIAILSVAANKAEERAKKAEMTLQSYIEMDMLGLHCSRGLND
jgi:hypothetical protein